MSINGQMAPPFGSGRFVRRVGHSLDLGTIVEYRFTGPSPFVVRAHRLGVEMIGIMPCVDREGITVVQQVLERATKHHEHLKTFPIGTKQEVLDEATLWNQENQAESKPEESKSLIALGPRLVV